MKVIRCDKCHRMATRRTIEGVYCDEHLPQSKTETVLEVCREKNISTITEHLWSLNPQDFVECRCGGNITKDSGECDGCDTPEPVL
jgi:hypothetical protein